MAYNYLLAQGQAKLATEEDLQRDVTGITNPNLHRRIDQDLSFISEAIVLSTDNDEIIGTDTGDYIAVPSRVEGGAANYTLSVSGVNSYRTTQTLDADPDSEIP